jgi:hypothetical protein
MTLEERCKLATDCLPPSEYRTRLEALHAELLALRKEAAASDLCDQLGPVAYRLKDTEATAAYKQDVFVFWSSNEVAGSVIEELEPLFRQASIDAAVDAVRERIALLVQAVRDANATEANGDYPFRLLTAAQERAWVALMAGLERPNDAANRAASCTRS